MAHDLLSRLLAGRLPDPDGPGILAVPTRQVVIAPSLAGTEANLVTASGLGRRLAVVADPATHRVLGARVAEALRRGAEVNQVMLPDHPLADAETVTRVRTASAACNALVAVGSGTINDVCKYAAHLAGKPYVVFATAPSMNGYTSVNAAITVHGHKKTLPATAPVAVFFDLAVIAAAPPRMIRAGFGDSICRATAQADWLLAHLLLDQPYRTAPFALLAEDEPVLIAEPERLLAGDLAAMERLVRTLIMSGFGMTLCGGSYPASQGEHLISHYLEMMGDPGWPDSLHGEHIAVTTLTMARIQEAMLAATPPTLHADDIDETAVIDHFGPELGKSCWTEFAGKRLDAHGAAALSRRLAERWPSIRAAIRAVARSSAGIVAALRRMGAPTTPADIHVPPAAYRQAVLHAREIRNRYTFLDLAAAAGSLPALALP